MKKLLALACLLCFTCIGFSQVGIGTKNPDSSAVLDLSSTTKGLLIPRMTTKQRDAIISPAAGLQILNVEDMCLEIYDGRKWIKHCGSEAHGFSRSSVSDSIWFKEDGKIFLTENARIGIGTQTPDSSALMDMSSTSQGFLMPRMTTAQRDSIASPAVGLQIYNLDYGWVDNFNGTNWITNCGWVTNELDSVPSRWIRRADFGGTPKYGAVGFSINGKGYVGSGWENDFWQYDPFHDSWNQVAGFPGGVRSFAASFVIGNIAYVGTGYDGGVLNDFYKYDPEANSWSGIAAFPGAERGHAVGLSIGNKGIIVNGSYLGGCFNDCWQYDPALDEWTQISSLPAPCGIYRVGFSINGIAYAGGGMTPDGTFLNEFYQYNPQTDEWTPIPDFPGLPRIFGVGFALNGKGYIGTGLSGNTYFTDFWKYDPIDNTWTPETSMAGLGRSGAVSFVISGSAFVGTGGNAGDAYPDFWELRTGHVGLEMSHPLFEIAERVNDGIWRKEQEKIFVSNPILVGIGNGDPHAPLQFANGSNNRKIVLNEIADNDHQFYGLGIDNNIMRYQVGGVNDAHSFFAASGSNASSELMRIQGNGNVGIGVAPSIHRLDIHEGIERSGTHATTGLPLYVTGNLTSSRGVEFRQSNGQEGIGIGSNAIYAAGSNASQNLKLTAKGSSGALSFATNGVERVNITGAGNVGIGNTSPHAPLQFQNNSAQRKIVLWELANNDHQFHGFGINPFTLRYQVPSTLMSHVFYSGSSDSSSLELFRIQGDGKVGIGTQNPNELLEIGGNARAFFGNGAGADRKGLLIDGIESTNDSRIEAYNYANGGNGTGRNLIINTAGGGNVGIGVTNPGNRLDIINANRINTHPSGLPLYVTGDILADANGIEFRHSNASQGIGFGWNTIYATGATANQDLGLKARGQGNLKFITNNAERIRVLANGNVGISTPTPNEPLEIGGNGRAFFGNGVTNGRKGLLIAGNHSANASRIEAFNYGTNTPMNLVLNPSPIGNVGIGTSSPTAKLEVIGNVKITGELELEGIIENEAFKPMTLQNNFYNEGGYSAAYYIDKEGIVHCKGFVTRDNSPNNLTIAYLPPAYTPAQDRNFLVCQENNNIAIVRVSMANGAIVVLNAKPDLAISLDQISFRALQ